ncbi:MAG: hypothetical protein MPEBLZ_01551 [Candidatus Methanoperedens nitroreducens]|uniref:Polyprenyl synthetase n=1 Tax=Candidatus Methanoperedens nitratireducens TaxID=1392998 RepID=A0A0P8CL55_9EURY|nr:MULTISPECIES: DUF116 domain-containing protein [Methanoperedens]KAB2943435.1 MAG: DUF116 domain-containing protein [Candidatus Methanoperedens sp.]KPQ43904.1 MAG: hypothetical protein MPEBLZ_01551 [Candidatus Methanoperedens sp. BLZ1]CAG0987858.1 hypothetical protein METP2_02380 [Methanosarcinales archaeon]MBZ0176459.1 DUF116 domain-containing protein [Candidatus Methanoperedens nitroreducens]MCX9078652.1 DUF116 domain-containing protein [Candidatus Methanoperedens sp.]
MAIEIEPLFTIIGEAVVYFAAFLLIIAIMGSLLIAYSFKTEKFIFPGFMLFSITLLENLVKALFRLIKMDDSIVDDVGIALKNKISLRKFRDTPINKRLIFFPQCLRAITCPSKLSPEGMQCENCGACEIGQAKKSAEMLGYKVFIVPGSSFIRRLVRKHKPEAILGVGCMTEIKAGIEMCEKIDLFGVGIVLEKAGCVSTVLDWDKFYEFIESS